MAIIRRGISADHFTIIPNHWLRDRTISIKSRGLLAYIASHTSGWRLSYAQIMADIGEGRDALRSMIRELEQRGYLRRTQSRSEDGQFGNHDFELVDHPADGSTGGGSPTPGPDLGKQEFPQVAPGVGEPPTVGDPPKKTMGKKTSSSQEDQAMTPASSSPARVARAHRLPDNFVVTDAMKAWAQEHTPGVGWTEHEKFMDHFGSAGGPNSRKVDWVKAWRNWMRRAYEQGCRPSAARPSQFKSGIEKREEAKQATKTLIAQAMELVELRGGHRDDNYAVTKAMKEIQDGLVQVDVRRVPSYVQGELTSA